MVPSASFLCGGSLALHLLLARSSTPSRRSSSRSTLLACLPFCSALRATSEVPLTAKRATPDATAPRMRAGATAAMWGVLEEVVRVEEPHSGRGACRSMGGHESMTGRRLDVVGGAGTWGLDSRASFAAGTSAVRRVEDPAPARSGEGELRPEV